MSQTDLTLFGNATGNAESLEAFANSRRRVGSFLTVFLKSDASAESVGLNCIFECDRLDGTDNLLRVNTLGKVKITEIF